MKRIAVYITILLAIGLVSCNNWLYLEPEDGVIRQDFWQTKEDVHAAVIGAYASLLGNTEKGYYAIPELMFTYGEIRADMVALGSRTRAEYNYIKTGDILPDNQLFKWNAFYRTINNCNTIIKFSGDVLNSDASYTQDQLAHDQAEAYALRALMYFYLYRSFGDVPLNLKATTSDAENFTISKSPKEVVLDSVISDLHTAFDKAVYTYGNEVTDKGRITKYGVAAILADAYLWKEDYQNALKYCDVIINSGNFALVPRNQFWFTDLYVNGNSIESIFELQFSKQIQNPFYSLYEDARYLKANPATMEDIFPLDPLASPDSADIRADGCSYKSRDNFSFWKYIGINQDNARDRNNSTANFIVYRYAEILLFKAEALNQLGRGDEAMALVNQVRSRAHAQRTTQFTGSTSNKDDIDNYILEERQRELAYEGKRWFDVLRFGKRDHYRQKSLITNMIIKNAPPSKLETMKSKYQDTLFHYFPIPKAEIDANPNLKQNPYFEGL